MSSLWAQEAKTSGLPGSATVATVVDAQPPADADQAKIAKMQAQLKDWPDLGRYHAEDAALPQPAAGEQRVVFMGDSITDGWGRRPGTGQFFPGKPYINRGISGQTTPQMLIRFQQDVVALHPAAVVILAGTNDIAGNTGPSHVADDRRQLRLDGRYRNRKRHQGDSGFDHPGVRVPMEARMRSRWRRFAS